MKPHPHTGSSYDAEHVGRILKKIDAIPVPTIPSARTAADA